MVHGTFPGFDTIEEMAGFSNYRVGLLGILRETPTTYLVCNGDTMGIKILKVFPQTEFFSF